MPRSALPMIQPLIQNLLEHLARSSGSNYVLLRAFDPSENSLRLLAYAPLSVNGQSPQLGSDFQIPPSKPHDCWGPTNPFESWGRVTYPNPDAHPELRQTFSHGQQKFIVWVGEKAWFPLAFENSILLVSLLRQRGAPEFKTDEVREAWVAAQHYLSESFGREDHVGLVNVLSALDAVAIRNDWKGMLFGIAQCLASGLGLRWNRVWVLEHPHDTGHEERQRDRLFQCEASLGELNNKQWISAVSHYPHYDTLTDEIRETSKVDCQASADAIAQACCCNRFIFQLSEADFQSLFSNGQQVVRDGAISDSACYCLFDDGPEGFWHRFLPGHRRVTGRKSTA